MIAVELKEFTCPRCGKQADNLYFMFYEKPWVAQDPIEGLSVYGPYSADKGSVCQWEDNGQWRLHFYDRIVKQAST